MLTCYGHRVRLPQNNLVYLAFRLALQETLSDIELQLDLEEDPDPPVGYLTEVPFLEQVPLPVQVDLLADAWARQRTPDLIEASLLDAAVVYAACMTAGRIIDDMPKVAGAMLRSGPRDLDFRILRRASHRLEETFERFWDDHDFLLIQEWQDLPPDRAKRIKELLRLPDEVLEPMFEALQRWRVSPDVGDKLKGLMTEAEIADALPLLKGNAWPPKPKPVDDTDDDDDLVTGIEDCYHALLVGPCSPDVTATETNCPLVHEIGVGNEEAFDCTYEEWAEHFRDAVHRASREEASQVPRAEADEDSTRLAERTQQARTTGLEDGTRIKAQGNGWVVIDGFQSLLADPEDASWVVDPDDEDMPPAVFRTPEAACRAWERSQEVAAVRASRREEALRRLGKT